MPPNRLTIHQRELRAERDRLEAVLTPIILSELQRVERSLVVHLRQVDRNRPKLNKAAYMTPDLWQQFRERMRKRIMQALKDGLISINALVASFWAKRGHPVEIDTAAAAASFEDQLGLRIKDIEVNLRREVSRKVVAWYNQPGAKLGDIVTALTDEDTGMFTRSRAERIGRTEITRLNSLVHEDTARQIGAREWWWSTRQDQDVCKRDKRWMRGPDGQMYTGCRELHGRHFLIGQSMPPDASHPNCRCSPIIVAPPAPQPAPPVTAPAL